MRRRAGSTATHCRNFRHRSPIVRCSARLSGIHVGRMLAIGWGLAAAIGAVAGIMVAPVLFLDPNMMSGVLLYAFTGALLGGITSPVGAVVGGLIVGVTENLVGTYLSPVSSN